MPLGTFEGGLPAYFINTGSSVYGVVDATAYGDGVVFFSQNDSSADFAVSIMRKQIDENFV